MEWKEYSLGDISKLKYGNVSAKLCKGPVPIFSGYRKIGTCNTINCKKILSLLLLVVLVDVGMSN